MDLCWKIATFEAEKLLPLQSLTEWKEKKSPSFINIDYSFGSRQDVAVLVRHLVYEKSKINLGVRSIFIDQSMNIGSYIK